MSPSFENFVVLQVTTNISVVLGETAYLPCRAKDLANSYMVTTSLTSTNSSSSFLFKLKPIIYSSSSSHLLLIYLFYFCLFTLTSSISHF